jgi:hypothetical protein
MAFDTLTFLAPNAYQSFQTRGGTFTADGNGMIYGVPPTGSNFSDLIASGAFPVAGNPSSNFRNILDGGDFTVNPWQRNVPGIATAGALASALTATTPTYLADRFFGSSTASTSLQMTLTADTTIPGFTQSLLHSRSTGSGVSPLLFGQVVEPWDVYKCQGQQVTFSFYARAAATYSGGPLSVSLPFGTGTIANSTAANMITGSGWTNQANVPLTNVATGSAASSVALTSAMTRYAFSGICPVNATELGVLLGWTPTGTASGATDGIYFGGMQLEIGGLSPFEHRDIQVETEICQRFAWVIPEGSVSGAQIGAGHCPTTSSASIYLAAPVQFRAPPSVSVIKGGFQMVSGAVLSTAAAFTSPAAGHTQNSITILGTMNAVTAGAGAVLQGTGANTGSIVASADF